MFFKKKKFTLCILLTLVFTLFSCTFKNSNLDKHDYRYYIYLNNFYFDDSISIEAEYYVNNKKITKKFIRPYVDEPAEKQSKIWYVDIPNNLISFYLNIYHDDQCWYDDFPVRDVVYNKICICNDNTYAFRNIDYLDSLEINCKFFADYILSQIDLNSDSYAGGYNAYEQLNNFFYSSLINSNEVETTYFHDDYLSKDISVKEKMDLMYEASSKTEKNLEFNKLFNICYLSIFLIVGPLFVFAIYKASKKLKEIKNGKKC